MFQSYTIYSSPLTLDQHSFLPKTPENFPYLKNQAHRSHKLTSDNALHPPKQATNDQFDHYGNIFLSSENKTMATLEAPTSQSKNFPKKAQGPTPNKSSAVPLKIKGTANNKSTRHGGNLSTNVEQSQELPSLSNHTITFVRESTPHTTKKSPATLSSRPKGTFNRSNRRGNNGAINMDGQQTLSALSNHTITFLDSNTAGTTNQQQAAPAAEASRGGKGKGKGRGKGRKANPAKPPVDHEAHLGLVMEAAQTVTEILHKSGISCAVFGSLASKLYGCARTPKDVDMLVSQERIEENSSDSDDSQTASKRGGTLDAAGLKDLILRTNSQNFYLKMPRNPDAQYRILWYRRHSDGPECKVDILVPGTMHLPFLRPERVIWKDNIPLVPFPLLLFQKLQGWDDHCKAEEAHYRRKHPQDAADVRRLLGRTEEMAVLKQSFDLSAEELFTEEFRTLTIERVKRYCEVYQDRAERWKMIGFEIS